VCQMLAAAHHQTLYTVNCHMHTESSDFLGGLRPARDHTAVSVLKCCC
jgi:midasin